MTVDDDGEGIFVFDVWEISLKNAFLGDVSISFRLMFLFHQYGNALIGYNQEFVTV